MQNRLTFILGAAASGKSAFAESLILNTNQARYYLATAQIFDNEMRAKVDAHKEMRGAGWQTIEAPMNVAQILKEIPQDGVVLLDCATMWLTNHIMAESDIATETAKLLTALSECPAPVVVVSNEVGMGIVPDNALARSFRQAQGTLNQAIAAQSDLAVFVIAGLPMVLKGQLL